MDNYEDIRALLEKFKSGQCTPVERQRVIDFLCDSSSPKEVTELMDALWEDMPQLLEDPAAMDRGYEAVRKRIKIKEKRTLSFGLVQRIAASIVFCIVAGLGYLYQDVVLNFIQPVRLVSYNTGAGERKLLDLPDGSRIWLNAMSRITYPEHFHGSRREVFLEGEAFFEVKHNPEKPFYVRSGSFYTRVLGTSFQVKAYEVTSWQVTVASGKVAVGVIDSVHDDTQDREIARLLPNHRLIYDERWGTWRKDSVDVTHEICWREGKLSFQHASLPEVLRTLQRSFDINILVVGDQTQSCFFTADFQSGIAVRDILETFKMTGALDYTIDGKSITINLKSCR